jgi:hypothetical protein
MYGICEGEHIAGVNVMIIIFGDLGKLFGK